MHMHTCEDTSTHKQIRMQGCVQAHRPACNPAHKHKCTHTNKQTDKQTNKQTNNQSINQTHTHTHTHTHRDTHVQRRTLTCARTTARTVTQQHAQTRMDTRTHPSTKLSAVCPFYLHESCTAMNFHSERCICYAIRDPANWRVAASRPVGVFYRLFIFLNNP